MEIIFVSSVMPIRGGVASHINTISQDAEKHGYKTEIINIAGRRNKDFKTYDFGIIKLISPLLKNNLLFIASFLVARWILKLKVLKKVKGRNKCIIHAHDINSFNGLYKFCRRKGIKLILTIHGFLSEGSISIRNVKQDSYLKRFLYKEELKAFQKADNIIVVSSYHYNKLKNIINPSKVHLIHNFIDLSLFHPLAKEERIRLRHLLGYSEKEFILIYSGRLEKIKGLEYVLEAIAYLKNSVNIKLVIAGSGGEMDNLQAFVKRNEIDRQVYFMGEISRERLFELYNLANAFILVSVNNDGSSQEGTPVALIEAMACALPVITTNTGGMKDIVEEIGKELLVEEKSSRCIVEKISSLISNPEFLNNMGKRSFEAAKSKFSSEIAVNRIYDIYFN